MKLYIKFMVSRRCKLLVEDELRLMGIANASVFLGVVEFLQDLTPIQINELRKRLARSGLVILDNKRDVLVERVKNVVIRMIHHAGNLPRVKYSEYIAKKMGCNYTYLSNVFSAVKGITLQQFIIIHKIEKVKELLAYNELSLTEISYLLNYSSVAHLSRQFKKVTGQTPTIYKTLQLDRTEIENM